MPGVEGHDDRLDREFAIKLGSRIRELRESHGWTQEELGGRLTDSSYRKDMIGKIERGKQLPSLKVLLSLSRILDVDILDLIPPVG